jgi:TetR/AcrR family transcriptional repressor of nem operon
MIEGALVDPQRRGCLIANTVMELAPHEKVIAGKVNMALKMGEDAFFGLLTRAKKQGELGADKDPRTIARFLTTMMQGTIVMIKAGASADAVRQSTEMALSTLE